MYIRLLIPGNVEHLRQYAENSGNMGLTGIYMDILYKRNLLYCSFVLLVSTFWYGIFYRYLGLFLFSAWVCVFIITVNKWYYFIEMDLEIMNININ